MLLVARRGGDVMLYVLIAVLAVLIFLCLPGFGQTAR
jgi:Tfp pilus assembly protein FimT